VVALGISEDGGWADRGISEATLAGEIDAIEPLGLPVASTLHHLTNEPPEVVFPIVHGTWGEDGTLQGLCEMLDLPYVGAGVTASAVAMDKVAAKRALAAAGVPVVEYAAVRRAGFEADPAAFAEEAARLPGPPWFVKPSVGGSSVGVKKVSDRADLEVAIAFALRFDDAVLVERGVAGRELECAVLGHRELAASEIGEIVPGRDFYDYEDKYLTDGAELIAPATLAPGVKERLQETAVAAFAALGGSGMARVDFLLEVNESSGETAYVNEINTLPGFTSISMYPRLWGLSGVPLAELTDRLVTHALERHADRRRLDDGIKEFLSSLAEERAGA